MEEMKVTEVSNEITLYTQEIGRLNRLEKEEFEKMLGRLSETIEKANKKIDITFHFLKNEARGELPTWFRGVIQGSYSSLKIMKHTNLGTLKIITNNFRVAGVFNEMRSKKIEVVDDKGQPMES